MPAGALRSVTDGTRAVSIATGVLNAWPQCPIEQTQPHPVQSSDVAPPAASDATAPSACCSIHAAPHPSAAHASASMGLAAAKNSARKVTTTPSLLTCSPNARIMGPVITYSGKWPVILQTGVF